MFEKILSDRLRINIIKDIKKRYDYDGKPIHKGSLNGLVTVLTRVLMYGENHKHFNSDGHFSGNHILYSELKILKRNKLAQKFIHYNLDSDGEYNGEQLPFFRRADDSTYHANNARFGYNGYSHWYVYSNMLYKTISETYHFYKLALNHTNKFSGNVDEYVHNINDIIAKPIDLDEKKYIKVPKEKFINLVNKFIDGVYEGIGILIKRAEYVDDKYVYVLNITDTATSLNGKGRTYTTLSSLRKDVRAYILEGLTEIDLNTSAQSVLLNLYYNRKLDTDALEKEFPKHYLLLTNKTRFREKVAYYFKCDINEAKEIITAITYSPNSRIIFKRCSLNGFSAKRIKEAKKFIEPFIEESKMIRDKVLSVYNVGKIKDLIDSDIKEANKKLKGNGKGKSIKDKSISRIYTIFEKIIRDSMIEYLHSQGIENVYQIHDCVIFKGDINVRDLQSYVMTKTSFNIGVARVLY